MSGVKSRWSHKRLNAAASAVAAMLAGEDNEGDWPEDVTRADLDGALRCLFEMQRQSPDDEKGARS